VITTPKAAAFTLTGGVDDFQVQDFKMITSTGTHVAHGWGYI
jgi:hypothetical protein